MNLVGNAVKFTGWRVGRFRAVADIGRARFRAAGGFPAYAERCTAVAKRGYDGFVVG